MLILDISILATDIQYHFLPLTGILVLSMFTAKPPVFGPCKLLDFELEMVCIMYYVQHTVKYFIVSVSSTIKGENFL